MLMPQDRSGMDRQLVSSHVRSLQPGHLTDVQTTDQHVVKPWFNGRIDFSPPVPELAPDGFPLVGGRLDAVDGKTVAAIVYKRRLHIVNLFVWRAAAAGERAVEEDGFAVREWSAGGLRFAAVSDIAPQELGRFEATFRDRTK
jgi:anti-sigma factor RsiW